MKRIDILDYFETPVESISSSLHPLIVRLHEGEMPTPAMQYEEKRWTFGELPHWNSAYQEDVNLIQPRSNTWIANLYKFRHSWKSLEITYNLTDMKTLFGIRKVGPKLPEYEQEMLVKHIAPLAVLGIVETADGYVVYEVRGKTIQAGGKILQFPAGNIEYMNDLGRIPTPLEELYEEAAEEIGFDTKDMKEINLHPIGVVRDRTDSWNPPIIFVMNTPMDIKKIEEKYKIAHKISPEESERFLPQQIDERKIRDFVLNNANTFVGNGIGATLLYGIRTFGRKWADDLTARLNDVGYQIVEDNPYSSY